MEIVKETERKRGGERWGETGGGGGKPNMREAEREGGERQRVKIERQRERGGERQREKER